LRAIAPTTLPPAVAVAPNRKTIFSDVDMVEPPLEDEDDAPMVEV